MGRQEWRTRRLLRAMERDARRAERAGRPGSAWPLLGLVAVTVLAVFGVGAYRSGVDLRDPEQLLAMFRPKVYVEVDGEAIAVPRPEPADGRLLPEVPVATEGAYSFLRTDAEGGPIGYDPCRPVTWVLRAQGVPAGGEDLVVEAVAEISASTGLQFVYQGTTDEAPDLERAIIQPDRYGDGWAPVLVAWATEEEVPALGADVAGIGGSASVPGADGSGEWLAAGRLVLDAEDLGLMLAQGHADAARAVVMHELAHVVGLDHVLDPSELMNPTTSMTLGLGPGDRAGLALVGQVACQ